MKKILLLSLSLWLLNVTATFAQSCVTITQPNALTSSIVGTDVLCKNGTNGAANLTVAGGTTPYVYLWSNGATTEDLTNITAGTYGVTVTDANLCSTISSVTITEPNALLTSVAGTNVLCNGGNTGTVNLDVTGGTTPYSYVWSNGSTTKDLPSVAAGTYNVTVTDAHGCTKTDNITITEPALLTASLTKMNVSCNGSSNGTVDLTAVGGTTAYSYLWSNGATTEDLAGVAAGTYTVTVTDAKLCTASASITVTQPFVLATTISKTDVLCNGNATGAANLSVTDGTAPYSYVWSNGATTEDLNNIGAGTYTVTVTDANNCTKTDNVTITQPTGLTFTTTQSNVKCFGESNGSVTVTGSGGVGPYTYSLDDAASFPSATGTFTGLAAGTYKPAVKDSNGCVTKCQQ